MQLIANGVNIALGRSAANPAVMEYADENELLSRMPPMEEKNVLGSAKKLRSVTSQIAVRFINIFCLIDMD